MYSVHANAEPLSSTRLHQVHKPTFVAEIGQCFDIFAVNNLHTSYQQQIPLTDANKVCIL